MQWDENELDIDHPIHPQMCILDTQFWNPG